MNWLLNRWWVTKLMNQFGSGVAVFVFGWVLILGVAFPSVRLGDLTETLMNIFGTFVVLTTVAQGAMCLWRRHRALG
jgi:hypothetical protein